MTAIEEYNRYGEELEIKLGLQTHPIAVKMLEKEEDIPSGAMRPKKDHGYHYAQCQAFALSRRDRATVAMLKEDNWCPGAVVAYGLVPKPEDPAARAANAYDSFEYGKYTGMHTSPRTCTLSWLGISVLTKSRKRRRAISLTNPQVATCRLKQDPFQLLPIRAR